MDKEDIIKLRYESEKRLMDKYGVGLRIYINGTYSGPPYTPDSETRISLLDSMVCVKSINK